MARLTNIKDLTNKLVTAYPTETLKTGFLSANQDVTIPYTATNVGHIFGRMGVGAMTTPGHAQAVKAFQWTDHS